MIAIKSKGSFRKSYDFLNNVKNYAKSCNFDKYGKMGVDALREATPKNTGKTSESWKYSVNKTKSGVTITWTNTNVNDGVNVAILLQYGHGLKNGSYVRGINYINPALAPVFDEIAKDVWREVEMS